MSTRAIDATLAALLTMAAFARGFGMYPWYDDWMYMSAAGSALARGAPGDFIWGTFFPHWSPISFAFEILTLRVAGWESDTFVRVVVAMMVFAGLMLFATFARRQGLSRVAVFTGMATLAWHHSNAAAYYAFDCYDQIGADLLTWTILVLVVTRLRDAGPEGMSWRTVALVAALYVPALLIKEQALAAGAGIGVICLWAGARRPRAAASVRRLWAPALVCAAISVGFALLRWRAGLSAWMPGSYGVCMSCAPGNLGLILSSVVVPVRTLDLFLALRSWPPPLAVAGPTFAATVIVLALLVIGLAQRWRAGDGPTITVAALLLVASAFPAALLGSVTELYAHTALFWFALLVAFAAEGWRMHLRHAAPAARATVLGAGLAYLLSLGIGLQSNLGEMRATGERARAWRARFHAAMAGAPAGGVVLVPDLMVVKGVEDYGLYRVTTPGYLLAGSHGIEWQAPNGVEICRQREDCPRAPDAVIRIEDDDRVAVTRP
jgi:hypothetical protein